MPVSARFLRLLAGALVLTLPALGLSVAAPAQAQADPPGVERPAAAPPEYVVDGQIFLPSGSGVAGIGVDSERDLVYVAARNSGVVHVLDGASMTEVASYPVPEQPYFVAVGPTGAVYVSQYTGDLVPGTVSVLPPGGGAPVSTVTVGDAPTGVTVSPDGSRLYVANGNPNAVTVLDISDPLAPVRVGAIPTPTKPETITVTADGGTLYIADNNRSVHVADVAEGAVRSTWNTDLRIPHQVGLTADERTAVVSLQSRTSAAVFSTESGAETGTLPLANSFYQSVDPGMNAIFITVPFTNEVAVVDRTSAALVQRVSDVPLAYFTGTNTRSHATFVSSVSGRMVTRIVPILPEEQIVDPVDQTVPERESATFTAGLSPAPASVQWERRDDASAPWSAIPGATGETYRTSATVLADSGAQFRAVFVSGVSGQQVATEPATLTVQPVAPVIMTDPEDRTIVTGSSARFDAAATGSDPVVAQWQRSDDGGDTWADVPGAGETSYSAVFRLVDSGALFRAVFSNAAGEAVTAAAALTVLDDATTPTPGGDGDANSGGEPGADDGDEGANSILAATGGTWSPAAVFAAVLAIGIGASFLVRRRVRA